MFCELPVLGRCLFCLPLRRGVLAFGYLNVVYSAFMVGVYSFSVHTNMGVVLLFHGVVADLDDKLCLSIYCLDILFSLGWVYGAHRKSLIYLKIYFYYAITVTLLTSLLQIITMATQESFVFIAVEMLALFFAGLILHVYLIILTKSLISKLELSGEHTYENQLHMFVNGEVKADENGVYPATVVPIETV